MMLLKSSFLGMSGSTISRFLFGRLDQIVLSHWLFVLALKPYSFLVRLFMEHNLDMSELLLLWLSFLLIDDFHKSNLVLEMMGEMK